MNVLPYYMTFWRQLILANFKNSPKIVVAKIWDLITTYKMMEGLIDINYDKIIPLKEVPSITTRSHTKQLKGMNCSTMWRKNFFTQRIVRSWNELSKETVESPSTDTFKDRYDREMLGRYR